MTRSVILPGATIEADAMVDNSLVAGSIGAGATVSHCVVGATFHVAAGTTVVDARLPDPDLG